MKCKLQPACSVVYRKSGKLKLSGIYRIHLGNREGQQIWIIDGDKVCREIYPDFIMGGNDQRYRYNPPGDVWIDNRIGIEELEYTIAHELIERRLMRERGWTYNRAHDEGGLGTEKILRERDATRVASRVRKLTAQQQNLSSVYRAYFGKRDGAAVWIVDGPRVRKNLWGDFCFGTHDLKSPFVPTGEVWLDSAMSVEEAHYALLHQLVERKRIVGGMDSDLAYDCALMANLDERRRQVTLASAHEAQLPIVSYGVRERGVKVRT